MNIEQIAQSNIFFFVTTISVAILSILLVIILIQVIRILRTVREVSETVREEGKNIVSDISFLRSSLKEKGKQFSTLATIAGVMNAIKKKTNKKKTK
jgi:biopolymer transport protein ExbB/TolQ